MFVPVAAMPKRVLQAFVAAEDQRFFTHPGVDFVGVMRAVIANIANPGKRPEGASGITQQVAKNFLLTNQATLARKIREAILAFRIEETYSKERILELYLNEIYLGSGNYGVAQAAINYFDRSLGELTLSEIAYLAALPKAPNRYNIVRNEKEAYARRDYVLGRMLEDGYITAAEDAAGQGREAAAAPPRRHRGRAGRLLRRGSPPQPAGGLRREGPLRGRPHRQHHPRSRPSRRWPTRRCATA